ncbi:MAG: 2-oxo acid dehydrogenase subunit E2, partial [Candidatus Poribacteria bacterium]
MGRLNLTRVDNAPVFRKIAMGTWNKGGDPSVYGLLEIDMTHAMTFMKEYSEKHEVKITPTHLVGKAIARCMKIRPESNGMIRGHRIYQRKDVDVFFQVNIPGGVGPDGAGKANLSGCTVHKADQLSLKELALMLQNRADMVRRNKDPILTETLKIFEWMPWWMVGSVLWLSSFLTYGLNLNLQWLGIPRDPFGSVMITSVGSMGIDVA